MIVNNFSLLLHNINMTTVLIDIYLLGKNDNEMIERRGKETKRQFYGSFNLILFTNNFCYFKAERL